MKVVLMCGGIGNRMAPMIGDKALLNFSGKPLIVHQINTAVAAGLDRFVVIANPDNVADIKSAVSDIKDINMDFTIQEKPLGMADAISIRIDTILTL